MPQQGWAVWVTGLPGSGKSALAKRLHAALAARGIDAVWLQMDARRKAYFPSPRYTPEEREQAYRMFAEEAASLAAEGHGVIMDGSAHLRKWRDYARAIIPRFAEIYRHVDIATAMKNEASRPEGLVMAGLYEKALERKRTGRRFEGLGQVPGVDVPYEENPDAELVLDGWFPDLTEPTNMALDFLLSWLGK